VKTSAAIHDRYIIIDGRDAWSLGQSIKDAGNKPLIITKVDNVQSVIGMFDKIWSQSTQEI